VPYQPASWGCSSPCLSTQPALCYPGDSPPALCYPTSPPALLLPSHPSSPDTLSSQLPCCPELLACPPTIQLVCYPQMADSGSPLCYPGASPPALCCYPTSPPPLLPSHPSSPDTLSSQLPCCPELLACPTIQVVCYPQMADSGSPLLPLQPSYPAIPPALIPSSQLPCCPELLACPTIQLVVCSPQNLICGSFTIHQRSQNLLATRLVDGAHVSNISTPF
jgi:hypothetical protein